MAYTLTQARPLLNAAELELFSQSRAELVKQLTPAKLAGAVKRTRTLRDKYRDLYQRQTVAVRTSAPGAVTGDDNERTQRKADILQEVLERFEARIALLGERGDSNSNARAKSAPKGTSATGKAAAKTSADLGGAKKPAASSTASSKTAKGAAASPAAKASETSKAAASTDKPSTKKATTTAKSASSGKKSSASAQLNTLAGAGASKSADAADAPKGSKPGSRPARSSKAPSRKAPTAKNKASAPNVNAPLDTLPSSKRKSPLKTDPTNTAIQAHQSSQGRRAQGKRDSR